MPKQQTAIKQVKGLLMGRYQLQTDKSAFLGQGSFSVVQSAIDTQTGAKVAVKSYKTSKKDMAKEAVDQVVFKFRRQVSVLKKIAHFNQRKQKLLEKNSSTSASFGPSGSYRMDDAVTRHILDLDC